MLVGGDVTHPSPDATHIPSIAAVNKITLKTTFLNQFFFLMYVQYVICIIVYRLLQVTIIRPSSIIFSSDFRKLNRK
jgi:hypothetical protein